MAGAQNLSVGLRFFFILYYPLSHAICKSIMATGCCITYAPCKTPVHCLQQVLFSLADVHVVFDGQIITCLGTLLSSGDFSFSCL